MARTTPRVQNGTLTWQSGAEVCRLTVETASWYTWLEEASTFAFADPNGTFTARKERTQRGGAYWKAYRKRAGKLHRAYLGKSNELTLERLQAAAVALATEEEGRHGLDDQQTLTGILSAALTHTSQTQQIEQSVKPFIIPVPLTSLIGREQDTAQVCTLLRDPEVRLLTLIGSGGVGKTRLALHVAKQLYDDFADGIFSVPLASISDPMFVMPAIAYVLGVRAYEQSSTGERVQDYMQHKQLLLVLDNFEHLIEAASQLEQLLLACPRVKLLVTSRTVLHIPGEHEFPTLPLALPNLIAPQARDSLIQYAAVALFVQRAQAALPTFQLTLENAASIAAICVRLDGLPLAIELAAARIKLFPPQALLSRLSHSLYILTGGGRSLPERQQTLRGAFQWSYNLLSSEEQRLFRLLCVFVGGCTLEAIETICCNRGDEAIDVMNTIASLLDHSLVQQRNRDGEIPRLSLLETVREYGWERLIEMQELEESQRMHALYYLALAEEAAQHLRKGKQQIQWLGRLATEQENLRVVSTFFIEHKEAELALRLGVALRGHWVARGAFKEGSVFLEAALALPHREEYIAARAGALSVAGDLALRQGSYARALALEEESIASYQELEDKPGLAQALLNLGLAHAYQQHFVTARSLIERSIALGRELEDMWLLGHALDSLARLQWKQGDIQATRALCEEVMQSHSVTGEIRAQISPRKLLASIALVQGDYRRAAILAKELLTIAETIGDRESQFNALFTLGEVAKSQSDDTQALCFYQQSLTMAHDARRNKSMALSRLGELAFRRGNHAEAIAHYNESLALASTLEDTVVVGWSLLGLARIARAERQYIRAASLLGAGEASLTIALDLVLAERITYERDVAALRTYLGEEGYLQTRNKGREMTPEQALAVTETVPVIRQSTHTLYPNGLTTREMEILRLVALGWTDAQVAEKLIISPRTVQGHLRSVYNKIDVNSRSAATRYAVEHNLT